MSAKCPNCESHLSELFTRVVGDNDGNVHSCPNCPDAAQFRHYHKPITQKERERHKATTPEVKEQ